MHVFWQYFSVLIWFTLTKKMVERMKIDPINKHMCQCHRFFELPGFQPALDQQKKELIDKMERVNWLMRLLD